MNIAELPPGEMIMKYKSVFLLESEADELQKWFDREWQQLDPLDHVSKAVLDDDRDTLAKAADAELQKVRAHIADLRKQHTAFPITASFANADRMAAIMREYVKRSDALDADKHRSRRFNEAWTSAQSYTIH
jgi:hypothetical protein